MAVAAATVLLVAVAMTVQAVQILLIRNTTVTNHLIISNNKFYNLYIFKPASGNTKAGLLFEAMRYNQETRHTENK
jgi:hypothetical protein